MDHARHRAAQQSPRVSRARMTEAQHGASGPINQARPVSDPQNQTAGTLHSFNNTGRMVIGTITDATAVANVYRVQYEKGKAPTVAIYLPRTALNVFGPRELTVLPVGTRVLLTWTDHLPWGLILAVIPYANTAARKQMASVLLGTTRSRCDDAHKQPIKMHSNGYIPDMLCGRPMDLDMNGAWGAICENGMRFFLNQWMAMVGLDEASSLTFFHHDGLVRLAAYNLQEFSAGFEREALNDQDEFSDWIGWTPYPWEQMGMFEREDPSKVLEAVEWQKQKPWYFKMENQDDRQMPWHRVRHFQGYLGQGGKRLVQGPPKDAAGHTCYKDGKGTAEAKHPGLFDETVTLGGRLLIQSAKGISIVKRPAIVSPVRLRRPEQPEKGDDDTNYKAAGKQGSGPEHKITDDIQTKGDHAGLNRALGILDMHAYFFNYAGLHPFFYHAKDYKVWQESELDYLDGKSVEVPTFSELENQTHLRPDQFKKQLKVDHRYNQQDFYTLSCGIEWLDDGGMVIYDGYGGEIRMTAGSVFISAPGDVWLKSGRNTNVWAGWDAVTRAMQHVDVTASYGDIRHKAEKNYNVLAGNSGQGGVLIESRGALPDFNFDTEPEKNKLAGIVLRTPTASVVTWAQGVYLRTGGGDIQAGDIILDADRGKRDVIIHTKDLVSFVDGYSFLHWGKDSDTIDKSTVFNKNLTLLCGPAAIDDALALDGSLLMKGYILVAEGHILTERAKESPFVWPLDEPGLGQVSNYIAEMETLMDSTFPDVGKQEYGNQLENVYYQAQRAGNDEVIRKGEVGMRSIDSYRTADFKLYEDRWQQMARIAGTGSNRWMERAVQFQGRETYPYPGTEKFQGEGLYTQNLEIFDLGAKRAKDRGTNGNLAGPYAEPKFGEPHPDSLNSYLVIRTPET